MTSGSTLSEPPFPLFDAPSTGDRGDFRGFFAPCFGEVSRGVTGFDRNSPPFPAGLRGVTGFDRNSSPFPAGLRGVSGFDRESPEISAGLRGVSGVSLDGLGCERVSAGIGEESARDLAGRGN